MSDWKTPPFLRDAREASLSEGMRRLSGIALDIRAGTQLSAQDLDFVATAFEAIIKGGDPATSLGIGELKRSRGRPSRAISLSDTLERAQVVAEAAYRQITEGLTVEGAAERVQSEGVSFKHPDKFMDGNITIPPNLTFQEVSEFLYNATKEGGALSRQTEYKVNKGQVLDYRDELLKATPNADKTNAGPALVYAALRNRIDKNSQELEPFILGFLKAFKGHPEVLRNFARDIAQSGEDVADLFRWDEQIEDRPRYIEEMFLQILRKGFPALLEKVTPVLDGSVKGIK